MSQARAAKLKVISPGEFVNPEDLKDLKANRKRVDTTIPRKLYWLCKSPRLLSVNYMGMEPLIVDGSALLIDAADKTLIENNIYIFEFPNNKENDCSGLLVKRVLDIYEHGVLLGVDRPGEPEHFLELAAVKVMGKVKVIGLPTGEPGRYSWSAVSNGSKYVQ